MTPVRTVVYTLIALVVFTAAVWGGFVVHRSLASEKQLDQPGWCCIADDRRCSVSAGSDACRDAGGTTFNWDQTTCESICSKSQPKRAIKKTTPAPAGTTGTPVRPPAGRAAPPKK